MSATKADRQDTLLARYTDPHGRPHRIVLRRDLVVDVCAGEPPRLVAKLALGEGEQQARALLDGSEIDEGYLARARARGARRSSARSRSTTCASRPSPMRGRR